MSEKDKLNIPKKINVGFQERTDTYTGKLGFVIYTDNKGVLRKEKSWNGWRDEKLGAVEFENVPTSGFVLNKKVGETRWGWNPRKAWVRVYDPRDFEFEISVANLLFILEECSSIQGKGLEGEFVYSWEGAELVLLPVSSQEYKNSTNFGNLQKQKVSKTDVKEGCLYLTKDKEKVMYLGRLDWYETKHNYSSNYRTFIEKDKRHIFVRVDKETDSSATYLPFTGFTKLGEKLSDEPDPSFPDEYEKFKKSVYGAELVELVASIDPSLNIGYYQQKSFCKKDGKFYPVAVVGHNDTRYSWSYHPWHADKPRMFFLTNYPTPVSFVDGVLDNPSTNNVAGQEQTISEEDLKKMEFYRLYVKNKQGTLISIS